MELSATEILALTGLAIGIIAAIAQIVVVPSSSQRAGLTILLVATVGFFCLNYRRSPEDTAANPSRDSGWESAVQEARRQLSEEQIQKEQLEALRRQTAIRNTNAPTPASVPPIDTNVSPRTEWGPDLKSLIVGTWRLVEVNGEPAQFSLTKNFHADGAITDTFEHSGMNTIISRLGSALAVKGMDYKGRYLQIDSQTIRITVTSIFGKVVSDITPVFEGPDRVRWKTGNSVSPEEWLLVRE
jgi:hypothetical protein